MILDKDVECVTKDVSCKRCGYAWKTKSKMFYVLCPRCRKIVKINVDTIEGGQNG